MRRHILLFFMAAAVMSCQTISNTADGSMDQHPDEQQLPLSEFNVYRGNTHGHTIFTWTHGPQRESFEGPFNKEWQVPPGTDLSDHTTLSLNPDHYNDGQGLPANHFRLAKEHGYDFYVTTDHSQEPTMQPASPDNPFWKNTLDAAAVFENDPEFVALTGVEFSRNTEADGGRGHINPMNIEEYVNADHRGGRPPWPEANWSIPQFYDWLKAARPSGGVGKVVASFNHPGLNQYGDWDHLDDEIVDIITMFEFHTNYRNYRWRPYLRALNKGWKLSPVGAHDNHSYHNILSEEHAPPSLVLATELSREAITHAMSQRRTYVSWNSGTELRYSVNGHIMGSTLESPDVFQFEIEIETPSDMHGVRRIEIVRNHPDGIEDVLITDQMEFSGNENRVRWSPRIEDNSAKYFLLRVFHENDLNSGESGNRPSTISAPVWTGR